MDSHLKLRRALGELNSRMEKVRRVYSLESYETLLHFQVKILPQLMQAERCSIFLPDPNTKKVWLKFGTNLQEKQIEAPLYGSVVGQVISSGEGMIVNRMNEGGFHKEAEKSTGFVTKNMVCVPIKSLVDGEVLGALQILNKLKGQHFDGEDMALLEEMARHLAMILDNIVVRSEMVRLSRQLSQEMDQLEQQPMPDRPFVAESRAMREVMAITRMVSSTPVNVVIQGENGTGKELIARMIHQFGAPGKSFVAINCAAIPENLLESEFFGYEKGAFTGAENTRKGRFEEAQGGVLFLDEIGEMPATMQPKFLRAIQEREGSRLGSNKVIPYHFRLVCATNQDLRQQVARGRFREDLYYRLYSVEIRIPPLRERKEDILPLANYFLDEIRQRFNKWVEGYSAEVGELFVSYPWPGNVRQLRQEVERLVALTADGREVQVSSCSESLRRHYESHGPVLQENILNIPQQVEKLENHLIQLALQKTHGNKLQAAQLLGITRQGLHNKLSRQGGDGIIKGD
ncbi:MAG: sigma 54-interacting transcriptional regulator [Magnetococcales bacterium]|nr:sigma 54-interacting transcriptional regulator [Magnetococcales bacterium]